MINIRISINNDKLFANVKLVEQRYVSNKLCKYCIIFFKILHNLFISVL